MKYLKPERSLRARIDIMYSPPPDEAAEALARDPIDPVEATERFLEDAAADTDPPGKDEHTPHLASSSSSSETPLFVPRKKEEATPRAFQNKSDALIYSEPSPSKAPSRDVRGEYITLTESKEEKDWVKL